MALTLAFSYWPPSSLAPVQLRIIWQHEDPTHTYISHFYVNTSDFMLLSFYIPTSSCVNDTIFIAARVFLPAGNPRGAAHPSVVGLVAVTELPLAAAVSVGLGTAHVGMSRCAHCACWGSPLCSTGRPYTIQARKK